MSWKDILKYDEWDNIQQSIDTLTDKIESLNHSANQIQTALGLDAFEGEEKQRKEKLYYKLVDEMTELGNRKKELEEKLRRRFQ